MNTNSNNMNTRTNTPDPRPTPIHVLEETGDVSWALFSEDSLTESLLFVGACGKTSRVVCSVLDSKKV